MTDHSYLIWSIESESQIMGSKNIYPMQREHTGPLTGVGV